LLDQERRPSNLVLYLVCLNHFVNDSSVFVISALIPAVIISFGFSKFEVGVLVAIGYLVNMVFQPMTGRYSERFEARNLMSFGIALMGVAMLMFTVSTTFFPMVVSILVLRFGSSFFHPVGVSAISRSYSGTQLDRAMGIQSAFGNLGILLVFLIATPLFVVFGWQAPFLVYAALDLVTVGTTIALFSKTSSKGDDNTPYAKEIPASENQIEKKKLTFGLPFFFIVASFVSGGSFAVFINFGSSLLVFDDKFSLISSSLLMSAWVVSSAIGAVLTGYLTRRLTRKVIIPLSFLLSSVSSLVFALLSVNAPLIVATLLANGFFLSVTYPAIYSELSSFLGKASKKKGASFGILFSSQIFGASVLGFGTGSLGQSFPLTYSFIIVFALLALACGFGFIWTRRGGGRTV
jgi:FSR family fosmidomycin resistance protein-like MFS transporter